MGFLRAPGGLRQGGPLSPLLFVLVMEALGRMLDKAIHDGHMSGFDVGRLEGRSFGGVPFALCGRHFNFL